MRNLPKGVWANFTTECVHCREDIVYRDGRQERHECRERPALTVWATDEEVAEGQAFYRDTMARLNQALDNR